MFIPFHYQGEVVSWLTRSIGDKGQRYISASEGEESMDHKGLLYGANHCGHACVVVEGPLDAWAIGPGAVALCGTGYSRAQLLRISKFPVRVICLDRGIEAQRVRGEDVQGAGRVSGGNDKCRIGD